MGRRRERFVQRRKACGYSQEDLAEQLGIERSTVARWERGLTDPQPWVRPRLLQALQVSTDELETLIAASDAGAVERSRRSTRTEVGAREPAAPGRATWMTNAPTPPTMNPDELGHIVLALDDARHYLDGSAVNCFSRQLAEYASQDGARGPRQTLPAVLGLVTAIETSAREVKPSVRKDLLAVGAKGAEFAGWLYRDAGFPAMAAHWRDRAVEWAGESGHHAMQGYVLLRKSQSAWDSREALRMLTLSQAAQDGPWSLPPKVRAEAAQQEARARAMLGDEASRIERKLDEAGRLLSKEGGADDTPTEGTLNGRYGGSLLAMQSAICYDEAGQHARAAEMCQQQLATRPFSYRDHGYFLSPTANALASAGEPDEAVATGLESLSVATSTESTRTTSELHRLAGRLCPWLRRSTVRDFREALAG